VGDHFSLWGLSFNRCQKNKVKILKERIKLKKEFKIGKSLTVSLDLVIMLGLFLLFSLGGFHYLKGYNGHPEFFQKSFGPALMFACDKGLVNPKRVPGSTIDNFLSEKVKSFSPKNLPEDVQIEKYDLLQGGSIYLELSVGIIWKVLGISWSNVFFLNALLFGIMAVLCYAILRLGLNRIYSVLGTLFFCFSRLVIIYLPQLRDFSKAPFIFAVILILGFLVTRETTKKKLYFLSILAGLVIGIGFGFRSDILVFLPAFPLVIFLFLPVGIKRDMLSKLWASLLYLGSFIVFALPILLGFSGGSPFSHVIILGLTNLFAQYLGLGNPLYLFGPFYLDSHAFVQVNAFANIVYNKNPQFLSTAYDQMGMKYLFEVLKNFPADILLRFYTSILRISNLFLHKVGIVFLGVSILTICSKSIRKALFCLFMLIYVCGYPFLQFDPRHYFHLIIVPIFACLFVVQMFFSLFLQDEQSKQNFHRFIHREYWMSLLMKPSARKTLIFCLIVLITLGGSLGVLRYYQQAHVKKLFSNYVSARKVKLVAEPVPINNGKEILVQNRPFHNDRKQVKYAYLVAVFQSDKGTNLQYTIAYDSNGPAVDYRQKENIYVDGETLVFIPVYQIKNYIVTPKSYYEYPLNNRYKGFILSQKDYPKLKAIYKIDDYKKIPLLLDIKLPGNWRKQKLYSTLNH
jgi:hypothetical protein